MKRPSTVRRSAARLLAVLVVGAAGAVAFASPASAHCGSHPHQFLDRRGGFFTASGVNVRTGPHLGCTSLGHGQVDQGVVYHCWSPGDRDPATGVNSWTFLTRSAQLEGWVNDAYLSGFGSNRRCTGT